MTRKWLGRDSVAHPVLQTELEVHDVSCVCTKELAMFAIWPRLRHLEKYIILTIDGIETLMLHLGFNLVRNINEKEITYQDVFNVDLQMQTNADPTTRFI